MHIFFVHTCTCMLLKVVDDDLSVQSMSEMGLQKRLDSSRMTRLSGRVYIII